MGMKDILGTISPAYGVLKGEGAFGKLAPNLGLIPAAIADRRQRKKDAAGREVPMTPQEQAQTAATGMKKGGSIKKMASGGSASKRADGCAQRGKTRGKMV
jgi:hypothetical protein